MYKNIIRIEVKTTLKEFFITLTVFLMLFNGIYDIYHIFVRKNGRISPIK